MSTFSSFSLQDKGLLSHYYPKTQGCYLCLPHCIRLIPFGKSLGNLFIYRRTNLQLLAG